MIGEGDAVARFERAVADYLGLSGGVAASSGTQALYYALKALGAGRGGEVVLPTFVCRAVLDAVTDTGARPVFCDIGDDWCVGPDTVRPHITDKTRAVIVVHTYGVSADVEGVCRLGAPVIEDCCPSFGGEADGRKLGTFGAVCVLSFYATKMLTTGEGGMVLSGDAGLLEKMRELKNGGADLAAGRRRHPMTDIQAALGLSQLARYDQFLARRRRIADLYFGRLAGLKVRVPDLVRGRSIFFRFPLRVADGYEKYPSLFAAEGIDVARGGVDFLLHERSGEPAGSLPNASRLFRETLSIPIYPAMRDEDAERVADACTRIFAK